MAYLRNEVLSGKGPDRGLKLEIMQQLFGQAGWE